MSAITWKTLLAGSAAVGAALVAGGEVQAQTTQPQQFAQVTSVSELSDVAPTEWYFQALQSLVERYGCIAGYPDGTFRGQRAMTRGEFAAGLNACLDRINELIAAGLADKVSREDLATVQRLQEEFAAELAALTGRVDALEAKTAELEANPLGLDAATSKLSFEVISGIFAASEPDDDVDNNVQVPYRVRMNFDASFTGEDQLRVRLQSREADAFNTGATTDSTAAAFTFSGNSSGSGSSGEDVELDDVFYKFPLFNGRVTGVFGINSVAATDLVLFSTPFDGLSDFGDGGSDLVWDGIGDQAALFSWEILEDLFYFTGGYGAGEGAFNTDGTGVFNGAKQGSFEFAATPTDRLLLSLAGTVSDGGDDSGDDTFLSVGFGVTWEITPSVIFSGWYAHAFDAEIDSNGGGIDGEDLDDWLVGFAFPDLFIEGANGGFMVGQPDFFVALDTGEDESPFQAEVYYSFPLTENLTVTPGVYYISEVDGDDDIVVGGIRTTFKF
ncbi:MAG: iron uptake porin [Synechococcus sp.]